LDDLRSLLIFLHFEPFCTSRLFEKHIVEPIRSNTEFKDSLRNLRLLLQAICLRRTETELSLPPTVIEEVPVHLNGDEMAIYQNIITKCQTQFDKIAGAKSDKKRYGVLFTTVLNLRRLCNHGTILPNLSSDSENTLANELPMHEPHNQELAYALGDMSCDLCAALQAGDLRSPLDGVEDCPICGNWLVNLRDASSETHSLPLLRSPFYGTEIAPIKACTQGLDSAVLHSHTHLGATTMHSSKLAALMDNLYKLCLDVTSKR
jgi:SWI/SNF-related matrix-associated actin-dependent regulator of chromatin subfamily A3